jgi:uncharacterized protein YjbJ (UPF0337 family)
VNALLEHPVYSASDKARIVELLGVLSLTRSDSADMAVLRQVRGRLVRRPQAERTKSSGRARHIRTMVGGAQRGGWYAMSAKSDQVKGHVKEAAGVLTGDKDLESEGKTDRRTGEAEEKIDHAKDKVEEVIDSTKDKVEEGADKTRDALHRK